MFAKYNIKTRRNKNLLPVIQFHYNVCVSKKKKKNQLTFAKNTRGDADGIEIDTFELPRVVVFLFLFLKVFIIMHKQFPQQRFDFTEQ